MVEAVAHAKAACVSAKLPTGYGKTLAFVASFAYMLQQGKADYLLYLVPRDVQVKQAAEELPRELKAKYDIGTKSIIVRDDPVVAIKMLKAGTAKIFVTTVQSVATSPATIGALTELLQYGRWFLAVDEYHNLPLKAKGDTPGRYWEAIKELPRAFTLAMTATPRFDNGNDPFDPPAPSVRYDKAAKAGFVKPMQLHHYQYRVDAVLPTGEVVSYTTAELADNEEEIENKILSKQMRWSPKYIAPLVTIPVERMIDLRARGIKTQMIVRAVSCSHAELVCEQLKAILPNMQIDWVGTGPNGRSDSENEAVLKRFCPPKDKNGKRKWDLDILVQRGIAAEGLDTVDVSEIVFLCPVSGSIQDMQTMGRAARIIWVNGQPIVVIATISIDSSTELAKKKEYLGFGIMDLFDADSVGEDGNDDEDESDTLAPPVTEYVDNPLPEEPCVSLLNVSLVNIRTDPEFKRIFSEVRKAPQSQSKTDEELSSLIEAAMNKREEETIESLNASALQAQLREQINNAIQKIVSSILRRQYQTGLRPEKSLPGDLSKRIRQRAVRLYGPIAELEEDDLYSQYYWLVQLSKDVAADNRSAIKWLL